MYATDYLPNMSWYVHGDVDIGLVLEYSAGDDGHDGRDQDNHHG